MLLSRLSPYTHRRSGLPPLEKVLWPAVLYMEREYRGATPTPSDKDRAGEGWNWGENSLPALPLTRSEQQAEVDDEIKEMYAHAQEILPDL